MTRADISSLPPDAIAALRWALTVARSTEWQPDGNGGPNKCFTCGAYSSQGHNRPCARFDKFAAAEAALAAVLPQEAGAPPREPSEQAIEAARNFLDTSPTGYPNVVPCSSGGVQLEWHYHRKDVEIRFAPDGSLESVYAWDADDDDKPAVAARREEERPRE